MDRDKLSCAAWVAALDRSLARIEGPVVLVAHSAGVMITVHWAMQHARPIKGALLAAPPDFERPLPEGYPKQDVLLDNGWLPTPRAPLPFPSIVAASTNDPLAGFDRVASLATSWGSRLVDVGAVGHLNPAAGYGPWPQADEFIRELCQ
jgi:predicted alpha/beta hydrolase family esterase